MDPVAPDDGVASHSLPSADVDANAHTATESAATGHPLEAASVRGGTTAERTQRHSNYTLVGTYVSPSPGTIADRMHACMPLNVMHVAHALALQHAACNCNVTAQAWCCR